MPGIFLNSARSNKKIKKILKKGLQNFSPCGIILKHLE